MILTTTYNKETSIITFVDSEVYDDIQLLRLEVWKFSHAGNTLVMAEELGENSTSITLRDDYPYRFFVKAYYDETLVDTSDVVCQLHIKNIKDKSREILIKSLIEERLIERYVDLRQLIIEVENEFTKSNFKASERYIVQANELIKLINKNK